MRTHVLSRVRLRLRIWLARILWVSLRLDLA